MTAAKDATSGGVVLGADIGGTNARLVLADLETGEQLYRTTLATADFSSSAALIDAIDAQWFSHRPLRACTFAIAGPVVDGAGRLTNGTLRFDSADLARRLGAPVSVLNDFASVACAIALTEQTLAKVAIGSVGTQAPQPPGVRAVLGPGTGLGMAYLVPDGHPGALRWLVQPSEGGNADFAPADALEVELLSVLQSAPEGQEGVSIETLLSGRGLPTLYAALCAVWGAAPVHKSAAEISAAGLAVADPLSHKTLELFCAMLGSAAGNVALTLGARGGVYLAGGILPRMKAFLLDSDFRRRFEARGPMSEYVRSIETFLVLEDEPGLLGAVCEAQALARATQNHS